MPDPYHLVKPLIWRLDAERAHGVALAALKALPRWTLPNIRTHACLRQSVWGRNFSNPVGLAAGFDKNADAVRALYSLGFGFAEIGGVTLHPQPGNPRPRLFRLEEDGAVINRMGLNSAGADVVASRLARVRRQLLPGPLAVNLGLNKNSTDPPADYAALAGTLAPYADMLTINVSSPNTPGLRALQDIKPLAEILGSVRAAVSGVESPPAVLIKIAPDLAVDDVSDLAAFALAETVDGVVISNTTIDRPETLRSAHKTEAGGLSGAPLLEPSTALLRTFYAKTQGRVPLVGVGGVSSGEDAYAKIRAGASLVQLYSALVFHGPSLVGHIVDELAALLTNDGFATVAEAVGAGHRNGINT